MVVLFSPLQLGHVIEELMKFQNPKYNIEADASVGSVCCTGVFIKSTTFTNCVVSPVCIKVILIFIILVLSYYFALGADIPGACFGVSQWV